MERYVVGRCPNTKDWFIYDNESDKYICWCYTEAEAIAHAQKLATQK